MNTYITIKLWRRYWLCDRTIYTFLLDYPNDYKNMCLNIDTIDVDITEELFTLIKLTYDLTWVHTGDHYYIGS